MKIDNKIYVAIQNNNTAILRFPAYNIETVAYIGKNGATYCKKEGDGKTPIGEFDLGLIFGTHSKEEFKHKLNIKYEQINENMYWVDDPKSKYYNTLVDSTKIKQDWNSAEHLIDYPKQYEYAIEIKTNPQNIPNKGSAIFLHCIENTYTEGCIAIDKSVMEEIIELINIDKCTLGTLKMCTFISE